MNRTGRRQRQACMLDFRHDNREGIRMDPLISSAARALSSGAPLDALNLVALRDDAPALALRGIALAQLGDLARARALVHRAARAFGPRRPAARARCIVAEAEIALVSRDVKWPGRMLDAARATLQAQGDHVNAEHARYISARRLLLLGRLDEAQRLLDEAPAGSLPAALNTAHELTVAGIAVRRGRANAVGAALGRAQIAARRSAIPALISEVQDAADTLNAPAARLFLQGRERTLRLAEVEALHASKILVVDACRNVLWRSGIAVPLVTRPVLFSLARILGEAWPEDVPRDVLIERVFRMKVADETHRARLRVEIGRLRALLEPLADVRATPEGFLLVPRDAGEVAVLARLEDTPHGAVLALLADGESWPSSALALALGTSQRSVQRALDSLAASGLAQSQGPGRTRRWMASPLRGFTTSLLLPLAPAVD